MVRIRLTRSITVISMCATLAGAALAWTSSAGAATRVASPYLPSLGTPSQIASTVPANGDVNPYGIAIVPSTTGHLVKGATLVSNFNASSNVQGTGSTIVQVLPSKQVRLFANLTVVARGHRCPGGVGLTTALGILPGGFVVVGSIGSGRAGALPVPNPAGCLIVVDRNGHVAEVWSGPDLNGPWDMATTSTATTAQLYVADALTRPGSQHGAGTSGSGEIVRLNVALHGTSAPTVTSSTVIGRGFAWHANLATFLMGPTGIAIARNGTAYVVETLGNRVMAISHASTRSTAVSAAGSVLSKGGVLNSPLGAAVAPNGDVLVVNGADGYAVEISPAGKQVAKALLVPNGAGALFGLVVTPGGTSLQFVNDGANAIDAAVTH